MTKEEIQEILEGNEFLTTKTLRIAAVLGRKGINDGMIDTAFLKPLFPDEPYNTLSNLLPHLKRKGWLTGDMQIITVPRKILTH